MVVGQCTDEGKRASYSHSRHPLGLPLLMRIAQVNKTNVPPHCQRRFDPQPPLTATLDFPTSPFRVTLYPSDPCSSEPAIPYLPRPDTAKTPLRNQQAGSHEHPHMILTPKSPANCPTTVFRAVRRLARVSCHAPEHVVRQKT
jgi:hypothetical protein